MKSTKRGALWVSTGLLSSSVLRFWVKTRVSRKGRGFEGVFRGVKGPVVIRVKIAVGVSFMLVRLSGPSHHIPPIPALIKDRGVDRARLGLAVNHLELPPLSLRKNEATVARMGVGGHPAHNAVWRYLPARDEAAIGLPLRLPSSRADFPHTPVCVRALQSLSGPPSSTAYQGTDGKWWPHYPAASSKCFAPGGLVTRPRLRC
ncbi:hypothetical protein SKAU_G00334320 [Synaphobranchus kaupii]|uniref:Uncharacterized protein n=1 Tax=Synaphobranchus kaupii TaxID=118154 RepID=A0A9Q1ELP7_SYNKA|nr:hypothetical protein SKAU_G00334320 [Synaphobranchus kaupii]